MKKKISILGSTGSIGRQALEVIEKLQDKFEIIALTAGANTELLNEQIKKFKPKYAYAENINEIVGAKPLSLEEICSNKENDIILVAVSGRIGLKPTITAINNGIDIALANKETLVMAGDIVMPLAKEKGVKIVPVDSEHCAILMNKGLEVIEAHHLFGMDYDDIQVVVHPQSIVHSAIEYVDGSVIAQLGLPSMHIPIQYAITYPERYEGIKSKSFSFAEIARLDFEEPDWNKFKALKLAYNAGKVGGSATVCLNASNEEAVFAFLKGQIKLFDIIDSVEKMMTQHVVIKNPNIDEIFAIDEEIRRKTRELF